MPYVWIRESDDDLEIIELSIKTEEEASQLRLRNVAVRFIEADKFASWIRHCEQITAWDHYWTTLLKRKIHGTSSI